VVLGLRPRVDDTAGQDTDVTAPQPDGPPALAGLCDDILRARPAPGEHASDIFYELIRLLKRHAREGRFDGPDGVPGRPAE
jgi:hypothetical protein